MLHVVCLQHLARACSEQSRLTTVLPINHVIQMPQCLSGFVNHDYSPSCSALAWYSCWPGLSPWSEPGSLARQRWHATVTPLSQLQWAIKLLTSNGSWCMGIKGEMSGTVCVTFTWDMYIYKQRVLMHRHQGLNVRHGLCHLYMRYLYIYELFIAFVCFVVCSLL